MIHKYKKIIIPNIGIGNIRSLSRAILKYDEFAKRLIVTSNPDEVDIDSCIIFPGVGNFGEVMRRLIKTNWKTKIIDHIRKGGSYIGICVGYQILFAGSDEDLKVEGLNLLPLNIRKLEIFDHLPIIGYKNTFKNDFSRIGLFYFIHSFGIEITEKNKNILNDHNYLYYKNKNKKILAGIYYNNIVGFQFHPEKSKASGVDFLYNTIKEMENN
jgi:imidazole glycerol phosphate synthase glutamine amidotransferase subunit